MQPIASYSLVQLENTLQFNVPIVFLRYSYMESRSSFALLTIYIVTGSTVARVSYRLLLNESKLNVKVVSIPTKSDSSFVAS